MKNEEPVIQKTAVHATGTTKTGSCPKDQLMLMKKNVAAFLRLALIATVVTTGCEKGQNNNSYITDGFFTSGGGGIIPIAGNFVTIEENPFIKTIDSATSTFSIDADGASYALTRRMLTEDLSNDFKGLRTEELVNYFTYNYDNPTNDAAIGVNGEVSVCPWNNEHKLIRIGIKGQPVAREQYPFANFVLLIDVSGSMAGSDKLELLKNGFIDFTNQMRPEDRIAIVTYAGQQALALESTPGTQKDKIIDAIKKLGSGGSTNGAAGIKLAYEIAQKNFITNGNNRVILGTDGDFNVGVTSTEDLVKLIEEEREKSIFLTTLGVGTYYLNDDMMEKIANKGNGNYEYLDSKDELKKVFVDDYSKFLTVAKDVKVQVTFNTNLVEEYRLIGYENRVLKSNEFDDDKADAGEIGAGQTITAIYEIKPKTGINFKSVPTFTIHFRYKKPAASLSNLLDLDIYDAGNEFESASENMRFAGSVAALGLYLRKSSYKGNMTLPQIKSWTAGAVSFDPNGYRAKHVQLLNKVK
jgi:Ca-activated chloride channel family protein